MDLSKLKLELIRYYQQYFSLMENKADWEEESYINTRDFYLGKIRSLRTQIDEKDHKWLLDFDAKNQNSIPVSEGIELVTGREGLSNIS